MAVTEISPGPVQPEMGEVVRPRLAQAYAVAAPDEVFNPTQTITGSVKVDNSEIRWGIKIPDQVTYNGVAQFVPGFMGIYGSSEPFAEALGNEGIVTMWWSPGRRCSTSWIERFRDPQDFHARTIDAVAEDARNRLDIASLRPNGERIDFDQRILVPQSMGGLATAEVAAERSSSVDMVVELVTCGYTQLDLWRMIRAMPRGAPRGVRHELVPSLLDKNLGLTKENLRDTVGYLPRPRTIAEVISCITNTTIENVATARDNGVYYAHIDCEYDIIVPVNPAIAEHVDRYDVLANAGHLVHLKDPRKTAQKVFEVIDSR